MTKHTSAVSVAPSKAAAPPASGRRIKASATTAPPVTERVVAEPPVPQPAPPVPPPVPALAAPADAALAWAARWTTRGRRAASAHAVEALRAVEVLAERLRDNEVNIEINASDPEEVLFQLHAARAELDAIGFQLRELAGYIAQPDRDMRLMPLLPSQLMTCLVPQSR